MLSSQYLRNLWKLKVLKIFLKTWMFSRAFSAELPLKKCMEGLFQRWSKLTRLYKESHALLNPNFESTPKFWIHSWPTKKGDSTWKKYYYRFLYWHFLPVYFSQTAQNLMLPHLTFVKTRKSNLTKNFSRSWFSHTEN